MIWDNGLHPRDRGGGGRAGAHWPHRADGRRDREKFREQIERPADALVREHDASEQRQQRRLAPCFGESRHHLDDLARRVRAAEREQRIPARLDRDPRTRERKEHSGAEIASQLMPLKPGHPAAINARRYSSTDRATLSPASATVGVDRLEDSFGRERTPPVAR